MPLPLGANAIRRSLGNDMGRQVARIIRESVSYALEHRESALEYALQFARDMDPVLADKFVGMYVNRWTLDYGEEGRRAVRELLARRGHRPRAGIFRSRVPLRSSVTRGCLALPTSASYGRRLAIEATGALIFARLYFSVILRRPQSRCNGFFHLPVREPAAYARDAREIAQREFPRSKCSAPRATLLIATPSASGIGGCA